MTVDRVLTFGDFRLDPASGHLYRGDDPVPLTPKAFSLLHHLALNAGRLVSKAELMARDLARRLRRRRRAQEQHPRAAQALGDDSAPAALHRDRASARLSLHRADRDQRAAGGAGHADSRVSYAHSGHVNIAYEVIGDGPVDLVFVMGWVSHLEYFWNEPSFARFLRRLSGMARADPLRQARHRPVRSRLGDRVADARATDGRRAGGDGGGGVGARGAARRLGGRAAVHAVRCDASRRAPRRSS